MFVQKQEETSDSKKFIHNVNYKGKNPMTKTQWRRFQHQKKNDALKDVSNIEKNVDRGKSQEPTFFNAFRKPATERIFPPLLDVKKDLSVKDEELTSNFTRSKASLNIIFVVSMLPIEYDVISKVTEDEYDFIKEMTGFHHRNDGSPAEMLLRDG
jgi:hypothetical protein